MSNNRIRGNQIKDPRTITQNEHEDSADAKRVIPVGLDGQISGTVTNPIYVRLSDGSISIGTVNAELEVQLSHKDNVPNAGDVADSVRIGDGVEELDLNTDGSVNANTYEKIFTLLQNANFLKDANFDSVVPSFTLDTATISYFEDGFEIAKATIRFVNSKDWDMFLERYLLDDDGSKFLDDDDQPLFLE
jgi:hypothetical protein